MSAEDAMRLIGVVAVWTIFLSAIRFALAGASGLRPVACCLWKLLRCKDSDKRQCRQRLMQSLDKQYTLLLAALTTPWSGMLLFAGMAAIGAGLSLASVGDIAQLVSAQPEHWATFDRGSDCLGALAICLGQAFILAALSRRRTLSSLISTGFLITGLGVGIVTAVHP